MISSVGMIGVPTFVEFLCSCSSRRLFAPLGESGLADDRGSRESDSECPDYMVVETSGEELKLEGKAIATLEFIWAG